MNEIIFSGWMGPGAMSQPREAALLSIIRNTGCLNAHITLETLSSWIHPEFPLHPAFPHLSAVHQCDYLRCYVMHVYGGGYTDVKNTTKNWRSFFKNLQESDAYGLGYTEIGPEGIAQVGGELEKEMKENFSKIIGVCCMLFKPKTKFTHEWFNQLNATLNDSYDSLISNPARHPQDRLGAHFTDGSISKYPFAWTAIGGDIFHPLAYKYNENIIHAEIAPSFINYR
jgi:hypothetical protein